MPPLHFPQTVTTTKFDAQLGQFLDMLKQLYMNIPFVDALSQMHLHVKLLKRSFV